MPPEISPNEALQQTDQILNDFVPIERQRLVAPEKMGLEQLRHRQKLYEELMDALKNTGLSPQEINKYIADSLVKVDEVDGYEITNLQSEHGPEAAVVFYEYFRDEGDEESGYNAFENSSIPKDLKEKIKDMASENGYQLADAENGSAHQQWYYLGIVIGPQKTDSPEEYFRRIREIIRDIDAVKTEYQKPR